MCFDGGSKERPQQTDQKLPNRKSFVYLLWVIIGDDESLVQFIGTLKWHVKGVQEKERQVKGKVLIHHQNGAAVVQESNFNERRLYGLSPNFTDIVSGAGRLNRLGMRFLFDVNKMRRGICCPHNRFRARGILIYFVRTLSFQLY